MQRPIDQTSASDSVGGLIVQLLDGGIEAGASAVWDDIKLQIAECEHGRAQRVIVKQKEAKKP
jgi:CBS domain containing-hemolysin-like protein